jgi:hypothetical protein
MKTLTTHATPTGTEPETDRGVDLYDCDDCLALASVCEFHRGWAAGWDDAVELMAAWSVEGQVVELVACYPDDARVVA